MDPREPILYFHLSYPASHYNLINTLYWMHILDAHLVWHLNNSSPKSEVLVPRLLGLPQSPSFSMRHHESMIQVTRLPAKNASAPTGCPGEWWPAVIVQVSHIQTLITCQKSQRSMFYKTKTWPYLKSGFLTSPSWEAVSHLPRMAHCKVLKNNGHAKFDDLLKSQSYDLKFVLVGGNGEWMR